MSLLALPESQNNLIRYYTFTEIESLGILVNREIRALDLSDDRLESVVFNLGKDEAWNSANDPLYEPAIAPDFSR